jgi:hypothetical protein
MPRRAAIIASEGLALSTHDELLAKVSVAVTEGPIVRTASVGERGTSSEEDPNIRISGMIAGTYARDGVVRPWRQRIGSIGIAHDAIRRLWPERVEPARKKAARQETIMIKTSIRILRSDIRRKIVLSGTANGTWERHGNAVGLNVRRLSKRVLLP